MSTSPKKTESKSMEMTFYQAIEEIAAGRKVTKLEWGNKNCFLQLINGHLKIHKPEDNKFHDLIVSDGDILGKDWIIV